MKALLLAAGYGTRLKPLTNHTPKCLVQIKGKILLDIWLERLTDIGVDSFLINTHYLPDQVEEHINNSIYKDKVTLIYEPQLLGTAGTLIANFDFFKSNDGLFLHADNYCLADLDAFVKAHHNRPPQCVITMMTFLTEEPSKCGIVELNNSGIVVGFYEKVTQPPGNLANGAIYYLSSEFLKQLNGDLRDAKDFSNEVLSNYLGRIYTHQTNEIFLDIGTPETYALANKI